MTIAAVALFAGCGSGSGTKKAGTASPGGQSRIVTAKDGGFSTVTPRGYAYEPSAAQYVATGPEAGGSDTTVIVLRQPVREGDFRTVARQTLRALKQPHKARQVSRLRSLSVDGEPALAVDYVVAGAGKVQHVSLVFVRHGDWVYLIRDFVSPIRYAAALGELDEVIRNWHWL
jgi:hypothetical protein